MKAPISQPARMAGDITSIIAQLDDAMSLKDKSQDNGKAPEDINSNAIVWTSYWDRPSANDMISDWVPLRLPRLHLLGLPQELQDLIFGMVFEPCENDILGAAKLQPLLTCQHIYKTHNKVAWAGTAFDLTWLAVGKMSGFHVHRQRSIISRSILSLTLTSNQVIYFWDWASFMPKMKILNIVGSWNIDNFGPFFARDVFGSFASLFAGFYTKAKVFMIEDHFFSAVLIETLTYAGRVYRLGRYRGESHTVRIVYKNRSEQTAEHYIIESIVPGEVKLQFHVYNGRSYASAVAEDGTRFETTRGFWVEGDSQGGADGSGDDEMKETFECDDRRDAAQSKGRIHCYVHSFRDLAMAGRW